MFIALIISFLSAIVSGYFAFRKKGPVSIEYAAKVSFFVIWSFFTVLLTLFIFKYMLKPTVEVKFNTRSWNEIMQSDK